MAFTIVACFIIFFAFFFSYLYIINTDTDLEKNKQKIQQLPSMISSLGVIGTFLGITIGLARFNPQDIDQSIPVLLDGLKTAFYTSLCGMTFSLILARRINSLYDQEENDKSKKNPTAANDYTELTKILQGLRSDITQLKDDVEEIKSHTNGLDDAVEEIKSHTESLQNNAEAIRQHTGNIQNDVGLTEAAMSKTSNDVDEIKQIINEKS